MPNHVENVIRFSGHPALALAVLSTLAELPKGRTDTSEPLSAFDFNRLVPMPASCQVVEENGAEDILPILMESAGIVAAWESLIHHERHRAVLGPWRGLFNYAPGEIRELLTKAVGEEYIANARRMALAFGETGYKSWLDWARANWGTKWNAYGPPIVKHDDTGIELRFQTAWNVPARILRKLAAQHPAVEWDYWAFDEGWNFYAVGKAAAGEFTVDQRKPGEDEETVAVYRICYGHEPEFDEEEDAA